jgi:integrase
MSRRYLPRSRRLYLEFRHPHRSYELSIERLCAIMGDRLLAEIRQCDLAYAANPLYPHCIASSKNKQVFTPAAAVLHYAAKNDLCPWLRVEKLTERAPEPRALRKEDAARLIAAADGKLKLLLVFLFSQGWRISDALRLTWRDVDLSEATVRYHISKTDEWLTMPLHTRVLDMLRTEGPGVGYIFPWRDRNGAYRRLKPLCQKTGIFFTPHQARHSFGTWLAGEGASTQEIMEAGAWRDHKSVLRYTKIDQRRVRATINKIRT